MYDLADAFIGCGLIFLIGLLIFAVVIFALSAI